MTLPGNPSLQVTPNHTIKTSEAPIGSPGPGQVKIHIRCTGICGSDIHFWKMGQIGQLKITEDLILGHETAGDVIEVGEGVKNVKPGDKVAIEPGVPCDACFLCRNGDYNLCDDVKFLGVPPTPGSMQRFLIHDARFVFKLPDTMTHAQGAMVEPLSVAYHGIERADLQLGRGVVIAGAGPIGLSALLLAKARGACPIVITDINEKRLNFAQSLVPEAVTYCIDTQLSSMENGIAVKKLFGPSEYDAPPVGLECTGLESSINTIAYTVRRSGTLMVIGVGRDVLNNFPFMHLSLAEIDVKFINRYHDSWPAVINLVSSGVVNVDKLVTHQFPLERATEAFEAVANPDIATIKVMIVD